MATAGKPRGRPFAPGNRAGAKGRPKGARNRVTLALEGLMQKDAVSITQAVILAAQGGDVTAAKFVLGHLIVPPRDRTVYLDLPPTGTLDGIEKAYEVVIDAVATGGITPTEASAITGVLENRRRNIETRDLMALLESLEQQQGKKS